MRNEVTSGRGCCWIISVGRAIARSYWYYPQYPLLFWTEIQIEIFSFHCFCIQCFEILHRAFFLLFSVHIYITEKKPATERGAFFQVQLPIVEAECPDWTFLNWKILSPNNSKFETVRFLKYLPNLGFLRRKNRFKKTFHEKVVQNR